MFLSSEAPLRFGEVAAYELYWGSPDMDGRD